MIATVFACLFATLFLVSTFLLIRTTKNSIQLLDKLEDLEDQLSQSLLELNIKHERLKVISKTEVFFDDPVVKEVIKEISECKEIISQIIDNFEKDKEQVKEAN